MIFYPYKSVSVKKIFVLLLIFSSIVQISSCKGVDDTRPKNLSQEDSILKVPLGDPFIMLWEGKYYAYGTYSNDGIAVYVSDDLLTWEGTTSLALHKDEVWADRWFWAPEVYAVNGKFYMYYSADEHICVATSDSPLGPFRQEIQKPMIESEKMHRQFVVHR